MGGMKNIRIKIVILSVCIIFLTSFIVAFPVKTVRATGNTLYVGGSGPGNYSTIQSAIDDANTGDTIFVYDESSPYYEYIIVNKTINLVGENRNTTIIDGINNTYVIWIFSCNCSIREFTIRNSSRYGILIEYSSPYILNNIIKWSYYLGVGIKNSSNAVISYNDIYENLRGLCICRDCQNINVSHNSIYSNRICGFYIYKSSENIFFRNNLYDNGCGIIVSRSDNNIIFKNIVSSCKQFGIHMYYSSGNIVENNNFISNFVCAIFTYCINKWNSNYWNKPMILPKTIFGFWKIRNSIGGEMMVPWINIDWFPAREPYDIL
jgi:parallel beta-helix repeat protein